MLKRLNKSLSTAVSALQETDPKYFKGNALWGEKNYSKQSNNSTENMNCFSYRVWTHFGQLLLVPAYRMELHRSLSRLYLSSVYGVLWWAVEWQVHDSPSRNLVRRLQHERKKNIIKVVKITVCTATVILLQGKTMEPHVLWLSLVETRWHSLDVHTIPCPTSYCTSW